MSEEQGSQPTETVQSEQVEAKQETSSEINPNDLVAKKIIDENKKYRSRARTAEQKLDQMQKQLDEIERNKLEQEGKFKEASEFYKQKASEWEERYKESTSSYVSTVVSSQVKAAAAEMGCIDTEALIKLAPMADLADDVDENYIVKSETVKEMLKMMQQKSPYLFRKQAPKIDEGTPHPKPEQQKATGVSAFDLARSLAEMTRKN